MVILRIRGKLLRRKIILPKLSRGNSATEPQSEISDEMPASAFKDISDFVSRQSSMLVEFGSGKEGNAFLGSGWGDPEAGFVWSEGPFSAIEVPVEHTVSQASLSMWGYVPLGAGRQHVLLFVNGLLLAATEVGDRTIVTADLRALPAGTSRLCFSLYLPSAKSPKDAEGVPDSRRLGIALANLTLE